MKILGALFILIQPVCGQLRSSANYASSAQTLSHGGGRSTSLNYANECTLSELAGISETDAVLTKQGFLGQTNDTISVEIAAARPSVGEGESLQLSAVAQMDDATHHALLASEVAWSRSSGPIRSISQNGLATAEIVFRTETAVVTGHYTGFTDLANFQVVDLDEDNFGFYAGDGLDDAWQFDYFGIGNPQAAPALDPDGDGFTNQFEFLAGLIPNDPASRFQLTIRWEGAPIGQAQITLSPRFQDREYALVSCQDLATGTWTPVDSTVLDAGETRTFIDSAASVTRKFYRVEITKP